MLLSCLEIERETSHDNKTRNIDDGKGVMRRSMQQENTEARESKSEREQEREQEQERERERARERARARKRAQRKRARDIARPGMLTRRFE